MAWSVTANLKGPQGAPGTSTPETSASTPNTLVKRDQFGGFSAVSITTQGIFVQNSPVTAGRYVMTSSEIEYEVYSPLNKVPLDGLTATGTPSATTYLRGDNTWATIPIGSAESVSNTANTLVKRDGNANIYGSGILGTYVVGGTGVYDGDSAVVENRVYSSKFKVPVAGLSATGTPSATNYLRGDGTWSAITLPANVMTVDTVQTVTNVKSFTVGQRFSSGTYVDPEPGATRAIKIGAGGLAVRHGIVTDQLDSTGGITEAGNRVYSFGNKVPVNGLSATGTPDATSYLRGDGTWASVEFAPPANMVTTDTAQTVTGLKTFSNGLVVQRAVPLTLDNVPATSTVPSPPSAAVRGTATYWTGTLSSTRFVEMSAQADTTTGWFAFSAQIRATQVWDNGSRVYSVSNPVPIAGLSATGTPSAATFLRGDNTWAAPVAPDENMAIMGGY